MLSVPSPGSSRSTGASARQEPIRMCLGCRERATRSVLLRVVAAEADGVWSIVPDPRRRLPGRGASLHPRKGCLDLAERKRAFTRALRLGGTPETGPVREYVTATERNEGAPMGAS